MVLGLGSLGFSGCVGGQSGSEGFCGENDRKRETDDVFTTASTDEDGGVEDHPDAETQFVADDHGPEAQNGPVQCAPDGKEY